MATQYTAGITNGQVWSADIANTIGAAWETWTPQIKQGTTTFGQTTNVGRYMRIQKLVIASFNVTISSGTGQASATVTIDLPITAFSGDRGLGSCWIYDASANTSYAALVSGSTTTGNFLGDWSGGGSFGGSPAIQVTTSDQFRGFLIYEAA